MVSLTPQVRFHPLSPNHLFVASRRSSTIQIYDLRNPSMPLSHLPRQGSTNQRLTFDLDPWGRYLVAGEQVLISNVLVEMGDLDGADATRMAVSKLGISVPFLRMRMFDQSLTRNSIKVRDTQQADYDVCGTDDQTQSVACNCTLTYRSCSLSQARGITCRLIGWIKEPIQVTARAAVKKAPTRIWLALPRITRLLAWVAKRQKPDRPIRPCGYGPSPLGSPVYQIA